jgi:P27 family predicted phage terminase small subunit
MFDISPPDSLGERGRQEWERMMPLISGRSFVSDMDRQALFAYCDAVGEYQQLVEECNKTPPMIMTEKGNYVQHPLLCAKRAARDALIKASKEFALTPWARAKIGELEPEQADEFGAFRKSGV